LGLNFLRKLKIYLDTSVISHLHQLDVPEKMNDTLSFWEDLKRGKYSAFTGITTITEIADCCEPKRGILEKYLSEINFSLISLNSEIELLADKIIEQGILTKKSYDDCIHIASAVISDCDLVTSWNFKHMVNIKTINGVRAVNLLNGYKPIDIYTPSMLFERRDFHD